MKQTITGEAPFQVLATNFSISPSNEGYTLQISADGTNYSDLFAVGSDTTRMVTGVSNGSYFRLKGNESTVVVNWVTQCSDGGSGGGGSQYILPPATENTLGGIKVGEGLAITNDGTLSTSGGSIDSGAVQTLIDANNEKIEDGDIIAGMAKQLYSPDGVTSVGEYVYRTTAGDEDVSTGPARLEKIEGSATYPEVVYNDSAVLMRSGSEVEGFETDIEWGNTFGWIAYTNTGQTAEILPIRARMKLNNGTNYPYFAVKIVGGASSSEKAIQWTNNNGTLTATNGAFVTATTISDNKWRFITNNSIEVNAEYDNEWLSIEVTSPNAYVRSFENGTNYQIEEEEYIPNDIPDGESTYTYSAADTAWTPSLPQAITAMTLNSEAYSPEDGDEIVITRSLSASGSVSYPQPTKFVALGLNSFTSEGSPINYKAVNGHMIAGVDIEQNDYSVVNDDESDIYAIRAVADLENGYVVFHKSGSSVSVAGICEDETAGDIDFSTTEHNSTYDIVYPTTEKPFIIFSVKLDDANTVCVHPRWSGYRNEDFEDYSESVVDLSAFASYPLLSIGDVKNEWNLVEGKAIVRIGTMELTDANVQDLIDDGKELGVDFMIDEDTIYYILDEAEEYDVTVDYKYEANDFSVEYLVMEDTYEELLDASVYVETWYMNNLVDKVRRMENNALQLTNLNNSGEEGKLYLYNGRLLKWVNGAGKWGKWIIGYENGWADIYSNGNSTQAAQGVTYNHLVYTNLPFTANTNLISFSLVSNTRYLAYIPGEGVLKVFDNSSFTNAIATISKNGQEAQVTASNRSMYISWIEGLITLRGVSSWSKVNSDYVDTAISTPHYEAYDVDTFFGKTDVRNGIGMPLVNSQGLVEMVFPLGTKSIYANTTGYSPSIGVYVKSESSFPNRVFVPTTGGNSGQVLQSNGANAEPTWATMIKVQKITSDEYENLPTPRDPNILYVIDDSGE